MGMYIEYSIEVLDEYQEPLALNKQLDIIRELREFSEDANYALDEYGESSDACSWYDHGKELSEFSKEFPDYIFRLDYDGTSSGSGLSQMYFKNGLMKECYGSVVYEPFDSKEFKPIVCENCNGKGETEKTIREEGCSDRDVPIVCSECNGSGTAKIN
jgi:DnaJ-class molecular chaperone